MDWLASSLLLFKDTEVMTDNGWKLFKDVEKRFNIWLKPDIKYPEFVKWVNLY